MLQRSLQAPAVSSPEGEERLHFLDECPLAQGMIAVRLMRAGLAEQGPDLEDRRVLPGQGALLEETGVGLVAAVGWAAAVGWVAAM